MAFLGNSVAVVLFACVLVSAFQEGFSLKCSQCSSAQDSKCAETSPEPSECDVKNLMQIQARILENSVLKNQKEDVYKILQDMMTINASESITPYKISEKNIELECFTMTTKPGFYKNETIRGCWFQNFTQAACKSYDFWDCQYCATDGCNEKNSASVLGFSIISMILTVPVVFASAF